MDKQEIKYCKYCGEQISSDSKYCKKCGCEIEEAKNPKMLKANNKKRCKTCGAIIDKNLKTCPSCGVNTKQLFAAQLKCCRKCGEHYAVNANKCPHCGTINYYYISIISIIVVILIFFFMFIHLEFSNNSYTTTTNTQSKNQTTNAQTKTSQNIIYQDNYFSVEYMNISDAPAGVTATYLQLKIKNNSMNTLTLGLEDVYVNDINVLTGTAMPITLEPGKITQTPFILFTGNTGLTSANINKLEFKIVGRDQNFNTLHTTNTIMLGK